MTDLTPGPLERPEQLEVEPEVEQADLEQLEVGIVPEALPYLVSVSEAFSRRLPSQRVLDLIDREEIANFSELATTQPFRIVAFRALLRDYPQRNPSELWEHAYDTEVEVETPDPTNGKLPMQLHPSVTSGT